MPSVLTSATATGPGFSALLSAVRDVYSAEIYFSAMPNLRFDQFATRKTELSAQPGSTIVMPKMGNIKRGGTLTEGVRIQTRSMSTSQTSITVREKGNAVGITEWLLQTSFYDQLAAGAMLLGRDMALALDTDLRDVAMTATNKVYAGKKTARVQLTAGDKFDTQIIHDAGEILATNSSPKFFNDYYLVFAHPHQIASYRQTPGWVNTAYYGNPTALYSGEVGRFNDFRFVETAMMPNGANSALNDAGDYADPGYSAPLDATVTNTLQTDVYQCVFFGQYSYGHAVALPTELRDNGVQDYGREHGIAWYAIWGQGLMEANNLVIGETA